MVETQTDLLYGVHAIAEHLGVRERQARHLCESKKIPSYKVGSIICASKAAVEQALARLAAAAEGASGAAK